MPNNTEFEIARWEYEGGSIGSQELQTEEPIPPHTPLAPHLRNRRVDWVEGFRTNHAQEAYRGT